MQSILHSKYYDKGEGKVKKYLVQTRSQAKSSGISLPEVNGIGKGLNPNILPEKQVVKPIITSKATRIPQSKPRLGQGKVGLRWEIITPVPFLITKPIVKISEKTSRATKSNYESSNTRKP